MTALTWPLDWQAELHDVVARDEEDGRVVAKLVEVHAAQVQYKAAIVRARALEPRLASRTVVDCVLRHVLLPSFAKPRTERTERDVGVIGMCLHFFRNLLAIRDPEARGRSTTSAAANATLQSMLVQQMEASCVLETLLMLASHADGAEFAPWVPVVADCVYHTFVGSDVAAIASPAPAPLAPRESPLAASLALEARAHAPAAQHASARHSRFGTMIQYTSRDGARRVARQPAALTASVPQLELALADRARRTIHRRRPATERGSPPRYTAWTGEALAVLRRWADRFVGDGAFGLLAQAYLRDIHAERERVGDLDTARCKALQLAGFFLAYARQSERVPLVAVGAWLEPWAFRLVRARAATAIDGREWREFVAAVRLWTTLLRLVDAAACAGGAVGDAALDLQDTLFYDGDLLDTSVQVMHAYGTQSHACLEAIVDFAYTMPRLLERHASRHEMTFVRRRRRLSDGDSARAERVFRFESYQRALATARLAHAATQFVARWRESARADEMLPRVAAVVHRLVVKANRPALFFPTRTRAVWARLPLEAMRAVHPRAAEDLRRLAAVIERRFAQLDGDARAAYDAGRRPARTPRAPRAEPELGVRPGYDHAESIGIAVGLLAERHKHTAIAAVRAVLETAGAERMALLARDDDADPYSPPAAVRERFVPHALPPSEDAVLCAPLRLLCRLVGMQAEAPADAAADSAAPAPTAAWTVPPTCSPGALVRDARIIDQYLAQPLAVDGRELSELVYAVRGSRPGKRGGGSDGSRRREARARKRPRVPEWIDNEFVENSDEEYAFAMQEAAARSWTPPAHAPSLSPASSSPPSSPRAAGAGELAPQTGDAALAPTSDKALPTLRPPRDLLFLMDSDDE